MFRNSNCAVIYWDALKNVSGVTLSRGDGGRLAVVQTAFSNPEIQDLPARLLDVCARLGSGENFKIILAGRFEGAICMDLTLPKLSPVEMQKALGFELPGHIPVPLEEMTWCYRAGAEIPGENGASSHMKVRVVCVNRKSWEAALAEIAASGIKIDALTHPYLVLGALPDNPESVLDDHQELMKFFHGAEELQGMDRISRIFSGLEVMDGISQAQKTGLMACLLIGESVMDSDRAPSTLNIAPLPDSLRPQRFRAVKYSAAALLALVLVLGFIFLCRCWWDARARYGKLIDEKHRIAVKINEFKLERVKNKKIDELIKKIEDTNTGNADILQCLNVLSQKLPSSMWISMFSTRDDEIDLTVCTMKDKDAQTDLSALNSIPMFANFSIRSTRRDSDGTLTIFVHIVCQGREVKDKDGRENKDKKPKSNG